MQLTKSARAFDARKVEETLKTENKFISDLFSILSLPTRNGAYIKQSIFALLTPTLDDSPDEDEQTEPTKPKLFNKNEKTRAKSLN